MNGVRSTHFSRWSSTDQMQFHVSKPENKKTQNLVLLVENHRTTFCGSDSTLVHCFFGSLFLNILRFEVQIKILI